MHIFAAYFFHGASFQYADERGIFAVIQEDVVHAYGEVCQFASALRVFAISVAATLLLPVATEACVKFGLSADAILQAGVGIQHVAIVAAGFNAAGDFDDGVLRGVKKDGRTAFIGGAALIVVR